MERKRRQGQNGATPKEICPFCGKYLKTAWMLLNRKWIRVGLVCGNDDCDHIIKDVTMQRQVGRSTVADTEK